MIAAEIMDKAVDVYKSSFWRQMAWAAVFYVAAIIIGITLGVVSIFVVGLAVGLYAAYGVDDLNVFPIIGLSLVVLWIPLLLLVQAASSTGHILLAKPEFFGRKVKILEAGLFKIFLRVLSALLAQIIFAVPFFIVAGGVILAFIASVGNFFILESLLAFLAFVGLIVVIALSYLAYSHVFSLSISVAIFEDHYFFGTIKRSWELIKTDFFRTLGIQLIWFIAIMVASSAVQGVFSILIQLATMLTGAIPGLFIVGIIVSLIGLFAVPALSTLLVAPLDGIMQATIYFNQRVKNEGFDVELRLDKLLQEGKDNELL